MRIFTTTSFLDVTRHAKGIMQKGVTVLLVVLLAGCAGAPVASKPRTETFSASPDRVLQVMMVTLAEQGFVIVHGDQALGRLDAEYAARPPWRISAQASAVPAGTQLVLNGRRGSSVLAPGDFDSLVMSLQNRLASPAIP
ncbi:hypothetical protein [Phytohalomonas tamaricis]|uniref:hypothetical protein n=1 Tax=Phytohalomonas tamaricis TaxID=2081032 RepID=UPI000D0BC728|nr:hypothetical protein [Phytohalomonas tamaricis]